MGGDHHLVRVGTLGQIGRFASADGTRYPRGSRVVCRTARGLEVGCTLAPARRTDGVADGTILRGVTVEDDLLLVRLEKHRAEAFQACRQLLAARELPVVLMEVEHLFDGRSLFFYFLGEANGELDAVTEELARVYSTEVQFERFAETLNQGCGPDCGTDEAAGGCGDSCAGCQVAEACRPK